MKKVSAGLLMYHYHGTQLRVLIAHPGGPFFRGKDEGHWTIPKGGINEGEDPLDAAKREFEEETGFAANGEFLPLQSIRLKSGKKIHAWAIEGTIDTKKLRSITSKMEWPPRSGKQIEFPEIDRGEFVDVEMAKKKLNPAQAALVDDLVQLLAKNSH